MPRCAVADGLIAIVTDIDEIYPTLPHFALDDITGLAVFPAIPYCLDLIEAAYLETDRQYCTAFRPAHAKKA